MVNQVSRTYKIWEALERLQHQILVWNGRQGGQVFAHSRQQRPVVQKVEEANRQRPSRVLGTCKENDLALVHETADHALLGRDALVTQGLDDDGLGLLQISCLPGLKYVCDVLLEAAAELHQVGHGRLEPPDHEHGERLHGDCQPRQEPCPVERLRDALQTLADRVLKAGEAEVVVVVAEEVVGNDVGRHGRKGPVQGDGRAGLARLVEPDQHCRDALVDQGLHGHDGPRRKVGVHVAAALAVEAVVHGGRHRVRYGKPGQRGRVLVDPANAAAGINVLVVLGIIDVHLVRIDTDDWTCAMSKTVRRLRAREREQQLARTAILP